MSADGGWRIDRTVTIALLVSVLLETGGALLWAGSIDERVDRLITDARASSLMVERLSRLEAEMEAARTQLSRIEARLNAGVGGGGDDPA